MLTFMNKQKSTTIPMATSPMPIHPRILALSVANDKAPTTTTTKSVTEPKVATSPKFGVAPWHRGWLPISSSTPPQPVIEIKKEKKAVNPSVKLIGGMTSGVIEAIILTPLDVAKTRLQLDRTGRYKGMIDCEVKLFRSEGIRALYKGLGPWTCHVVSKNGTRFYMNAVYLSLLQDKDGKLTGTKEFTAGILAGATEATLIVTPFEVMKTRLQGQDVVKGQTAKYKGTIGTTLTIVKNEGVFALWKGLSPTIFRQGLNQGCSFYSNSLIKKKLLGLNEGDYIPVYQSMLIGMAGGIPGPCINCPMDVVKTRLMAQETSKGVAPKYTSTWHCLRTVAKEEGVTALYKGLVPRLARLCPSYGIQWVCMDKFTAYFAHM